jgi:YkoY family integral membrane protein
MSSSLYWNVVNGFSLSSLPVFANVNAADFVTIGLLVVLEGLLSADNAMVIAVQVLGLPKAEQRQALRYGLVGAFVVRTIATVLAAYLIQVAWVKLGGAAYLLYLVAQHFTQRGGGEARRTPPKATSLLWLSPFWSTVVKVELVNIVFSIDSILVAVAMSPKLWVVLAGGILGIVMMRLVIGQLLAIVERFPTLVDGAFIIIAWVGIKMLIEYLHAEHYIGFDVPRWVSLGLIVAIFAVSYLIARRVDRLAPSVAEGDAGALLTDEDGP